MPSPANLDCDKRINLNGPSMATGGISAFRNFEALILVYFLTIVACAGAENVAYCDSVPMQYVDWSHNFTLPKFDSNLGILKSVDIGLEVNLSPQVQMENTGPRNFSINSSIVSVLTLLLPDGQGIKANASLAINQDLQPYDWAVDYSGSSGINYTETSSSGIVTYSIKDMSDFVAGKPGEKIMMVGLMECMQNTSTSGSASSSIRAKAGASVCVSYQYDAGAS